MVEIDKKIEVVAVDLRGSTMAKNVFFNILGIGIPYLVGFVTIPFIIKGMGLERFGILSLIWIVIGYFGFIDLGLSRATTKYVAEALGQGRLDQIPEFVGTTMLLQCGLGLLGASALILLTPVLVERILIIPEIYFGEVKTSFMILAFSLPIILLSSSIRGVLEAAQRFDLVNLVKVPISASFYILPLAGLAIGLHLPGIIGLLVLARLLSFVVWGRFYLKIFSHLPSKFSYRASLVRSLLSFGGWVTLSSIVFTLVNSADRFLIGSLKTVREVSYYSAPQEVVMRFGIIPGSLSLVLFPAFSSLKGGDDDNRSKVLYVRSLKYIFMSTGPILLFFTFFAKTFLRVWLGADFAANSTLVLQILATGFLVTSLSGVPFNYLQGTGRVALVTKLQIIECLVYLPLALWMIKSRGIQGAAIAFGLKTLLITSALFIISQRIRRIERGIWSETGFWRAVASNLGLAIILGVFFLIGLRILGAMLALLFLVSISLYWVLDYQERHILLGSLMKIPARLARRKV